MLRTYSGCLSWSVFAAWGPGWNSYNDENDGGDGGGDDIDDDDSGGGADGD